VENLNSSKFDESAAFSAQKVFRNLLQKEDNKIGLLSDLYNACRESCYNSKSLYLKALLVQMNEAADQALGNVQIDNLHLLDKEIDKPDLSFMGLPEILESANEVLSPKSSGRGKSVEGGKPPRGDKKAKNVSASVGRKKYQEIEEDDLDGGLFETPLTPQQLKRKGELRLRGHLLIV